MCGIVGVGSYSPVADRGWLVGARDAMRHRGPDDAGEWWSVDGTVGFAHRRLAIVDLSSAGHQPMQDVRGDTCITFNGEIYNFVDLRRELSAKGHSFHSQTDTEVILAAYREWGVGCLEHLNGMFAFALFDGRSRDLFLARDRAGEKPLFYYQDGAGIRFASELKGLIADNALPRRIDPEALDCYLTLGYVPAGRCILQGFNKLPPAHALLLNLGNRQARLWRYWSLPEFDPAPAKLGGEGALLAELEELLEDSVRRQLIADVPTGVLLSGGMDSSLVTAMAARAATKLKTFTIRFPGYGKYDETEHARLIARHFGTEHMELDASEATVDLLPALARQFDEPMIDSSMIPTFLVARLVREHCTVALGGDGGDELFGGYGRYSGLLRTQETLGNIPHPVRLLAAKAAAVVLPAGYKGRNLLQVLAADLRESLPLAIPHFDRSMRRELMPRRGAWPLVGEQIWEQSVPRTRDLLERATRADFVGYMPEDILVKVDRASMLSSLEVRAPLLDYRLVEFAFRKVPGSMKADRAERKILLKRLATKVLPPQFDGHRKQGFSIPLSDWLNSSPWREFFSSTLLEGGDGFFDRKALQGLLEGQARGRANSERLFALVMFELWRKEYRL